MSKGIPKKYSCKKSQKIYEKNHGEMPIGTLEGNSGWSSEKIQRNWRNLCMNFGRNSWWNPWNESCKFVVIPKEIPGDIPSKMSTGIATEIPEAIPRGFRKKNVYELFEAPLEKFQKKSLEQFLKESLEESLKESLHT